MLDEYVKAHNFGFPGMLGSMNCTHWDWKKLSNNIAKTGHMRWSSTPHDVTWSCSLTIFVDWHAYFGVLGGNNDLNVLYQSLLFIEKPLGITPKCSFYLNGEKYKYMYYLPDEIYPSWVHPTTDKKKWFKTTQEATIKGHRTDFCVLKSCWGHNKTPYTFTESRHV